MKYAVKMMNANNQEPLTAKDRITRDRIKLNEIIVNAILFGLGLNLIADFITGLPDSIVNPVMSISFIGGVLLTVGSYWLMLKQYLGDETRISEKIKIGLFFDKNTGDLIHFDLNYVPHEILRYYFSRNPSQIRESISERIKNGEIEAVEELFEIILKYLFGDKDFFSKYPPPHYLSDFVGDLSLISKDQSFGEISKKHMKGRTRFVIDSEERKGSIDYKVEEKQLNYTSEYTSGYRVQLLSIRPYIKLSDIWKNYPEELAKTQQKPPSDIILFEFDTEFIFTFSSFRLHAQGEKVSVAIEDTNDFVQVLLDFFDWVKYQNRIVFGKQMMELGKSAAFERGGFWP